MATRQPKSQAFTVDEVEAAEQTLLQDDSFNGAAISPALETLFSELGLTDNADASVHVTLLNVDGSGKEANIWRGLPEDYDLERLAKEFGSGDYRVKIYVRSSTGGKSIRANKVFSWKLSAKEEEARKNPKPDAPAFNPNDLARIISESIRAAMPPPAPPAPVVNPMAQMKEFAELMNMMRPPEPVHAPAANTLSSLRDMAELMDMLRGGNDSAPPVGTATGNDLMLKMIDKFGPLFMNVLASQGAPAQVPAQPAAPVQTPPGALLSPQASPFASTPLPTIEPPQTMQAPQPTQTEIEDVSFKLKMGINFLLQQCDAGGMPETYAEVVLDSVPADAVQTLINSPAPLDYLAGFDARCKNAPYADWLNQLIVACKEMLTPEGENNETPIL